MKSEWWTSPSNVLLLANALVDAGIIGGKNADQACKALLYYFSKPWKWDKEWKWFIEHGGTMEGFEQ